MKFTITTFFLACIFIFQSELLAQCSCTDCPIFTVSGSTVTSTLNISGATNPTLGVNGQGLGEICFDYSTDAIDEVDISLTSPDGTVIFLALQTGVSVNSGLQFNFCFIPCNCPSMPDPGFSSIFDSAEDWVAGTPYEGTYYPADGNCFESYTGPVNGDWVLSIQDYIGFDDGIVQDWSLSFLDNSGVGCSSQTSCVPVICDAYGGEISQPNINFCEGDAGLNFNITVSYPNGPQPNPVDYGYTYVITDIATDVIVDYVGGPDLTSFPPGEYSICGLSYLLTDAASIPVPNTVYTFAELTIAINDGLFCGDLAIGCWEVIIYELNVPEVSGTVEICAGGIATYSIDNYDPNLLYQIFITSGVTSTINFTPPTLEIVWESGPGIICVEASGTCGTHTGCFDTEVIQGGENIFIVGDIELCEDALVIYNLAPTILGTEMWQFVVVNGVVLSQTENTVTVAWNGFDFDFGSLCADIVDSSCEYEEVCIDVEFIKYEPPIALNSPTSICLNDTGISFVDADSDYLNYSWELTNLIEISGNGSPVIEYIGAVPGLATICLEITTICGTQEEICEEIFVEPIPNISVDVLQDLCATSFDLTAVLPAGGSIIWSQISGPSISVILFPTSSETTVITSVNGDYLYNAEFTFNGCNYNLELSVSTYDDLVAAVIEQVCISSEEYTATIQVTGGNGPFQVNLAPISGSTYVTDNILSGEDYSYIITDNNDCSTVVSGTFSCSCDTEAGDMSDNLLEACAQSGSSVTATYLGGEVSDGNDISAFFLHDNNGTILGNILDSNTTGIFPYDPSYIPGTTYYISYGIGNEVNGAIDLEDPCLSISIGQAVVFYGIPAADIPVDQEICAFTTNYIFTNVSNTFALTWSVIASPGNVDLENVGLETAFTFETIGTYTLEYNLVNQICQFSGQFDITIGSAPNMVNIETECSDNLVEFDLILVLSGGIQPYQVPNMTVLDDSTFFTADLLADQEHTFIFQDSLGCENELIIGPINCECANELGTITTDTLFLCENEILDPNVISNQNYSIELGQDTFVYLFYENESDPLDAPLFTSYGEFVAPDGTFVVGQIYYVRFAVGPKVTSGSEIDFASSCFLFSNIVPLVWNPSYNFSFDVHPTVCSADPFYTFEQIFPGPFPYTVTFSTAEGFEIDQEITETSTLVTLPIFPDVTEWSISAISTICGFAFDGNFTITALDPFDIDISSIDSICNNTLFGSVISLNSLFEMEEFDGNWLLDGDIIVGDIIDFDGFPEGDYIITFSSVGFEGPCPGSISSFIIYVKSCDCPIVISPADIELCSTADDIELAGLWTTSFAGTWQIENPNGLDFAPTIMGSVLTISDASPGNYILIFSFTDAFPDQCQTEFPIELLIEEQLSAGDQIDFPTYCTDEFLDINLEDLLVNSDTGGAWTFNGSSIPNTVSSTDLEIGENIFLYIIPATNLCEASSSEVVVEKIPNPDVEISSDDVLCFGDENGQIELDISDNGFAPYSWNLNGTPNPNELIENLAPGNYVLEILNSEGCALLIENIIIDEPDIVNVNLGDDKSANFNETLTIEALVNLISSDIETIDWSDLSGQIDEADLILIQNAIANNTITIKITDTNGCVAFDEINIRINDNDIELSNIFAPNGQIEQNRRFGVPTISQIKEVSEFRIYDRWGNLVHEALDFEPGQESAFWNGRYKGKKVAGGVFAYYVKYADVLNAEKMIVGDVTVIY